MENWVDLGEPATEVDAHQRFIVEHNVMELAPRMAGPSRNKYITKAAARVLACRM